MTSVASSTDMNTLRLVYRTEFKSYTLAPVWQGKARRDWTRRSTLAILELESAMTAPVRIPLPLPHIGSVNTWLLPGEPLTLIDTGPCDDEALTVLEAGLRTAGVRLEDLELVLVTHHHLDHSGLATTIAARSGARIAAYERAAAYGAHSQERGEADRRVSPPPVRPPAAPGAGSA